MDAESILETIAEIGVALAGFAGIVGALAGEKLSRADPELWLPFWVMISGGLSIVFAALFPFLPYHLGAPDHVSWAASSAFVTVLTACNLAFFSPRFARARRDGFLAGTLAFDVLLYLMTFSYTSSRSSYSSPRCSTRSVSAFLKAPGGFLSACT